MGVEIGKLFEDLVELQSRKVLAKGRQIVPRLTSEDVLQPNDYPALDNDPEFRYEEGILAGLRSAEVAILSAYRDALSS
jgi:hypothetical protein